MFEKAQKVPDGAEQQQEKPGMFQAARAIGGVLWDGAKPMFNHGRDELASALFRGDAHVVYGWGNDQDKKNEPAEIEVPGTPEVKPPEQEHGLER